jgi:hypothetical protein
MWKFVTGAKEPPAKKSDKDCQKEYELHRKLQSFRNEWAIDRPWFCFSEGAMFCTVCTKGGKKNEFTKENGCQTFIIIIFFLWNTSSLGLLTDV